MHFRCPALPLQAGISRSQDTLRATVSSLAHILFESTDQRETKAVAVRTTRHLFAKVAFMARQEGMTRPVS
jgi:hypothetical protein